MPDITNQFTCIVCPRGCHLTVIKEKNTVTVSGNSCIRGEKYGKQELIQPMRSISSTMNVINGKSALVSVKTSSEIPKDRIFNVMKMINSTAVNAPVHIGQVLIPNILNTGADIIATKNVSAEK